jgi:isopentenyl-diphosphate delta-isomerase
VSSSNTEYVIIVDDADKEIGIMEKMQAHEEGVLHRAISVFIFNSKGEMLLQQRAAGKYHSAGLWTNTCCSHPRPGEDVAGAAVRRLLEEMGLKCELKEVFSFTYRAALNNQLTEHELDHVFTGTTDELPVPDPEEVSVWRYMPVPLLITDIKAHPEKYTEWFKICISERGKELFGTDYQGDGLIILNISEF